MKTLGLVSTSSMNMLHKVTVTTRSGEVVSSDSTWLIEAPSVTLAQDYACYCASRNPAKLEWGDKEVLDMHGEVALTANGWPLPLEDHDVMKRHFPVIYIDYTELHESNNYEEFVGQEEYACAVLALLQSKYELDDLSVFANQSDKIIAAHEVKLSVFSTVDVLAKTLNLTLRNQSHFTSEAA